MVMTALTADSANQGSFSQIKLQKEGLRSAATCPLTSNFVRSRRDDPRASSPAAEEQTGSVITCALVIRPKAKARVTARYRPTTGPARVPAIRGQREEEEEHAEDVLAFRDPGHRLDIDRMQSEKRGDREAAPSQARGTLQNQKQEHRVGGMEKHVDGVLTRRVQAENLAIESMREPGDRVPVRRFRGLKSPNHGVPAESGTDLGIVGNVNRVVVIEKGSAGDRVIERERGQERAAGREQSASLRDLKNVGIGGTPGRASGQSIPLNLSGQPVVPPERRNACGSPCARAGWPADPYEEDRAHSRVSRNPTRRFLFLPNGR